MIDRMRRTLVPALLAALSMPSLAGPPPSSPLVTYELRESWRSVTPHGERAAALAGTVSASGAKARWEIAPGTFPRTAASLALADGGEVVLVDPRARVAARATPADLRALFRPPEAPEPGLAAVTVRDLAVAVEPAGPDAPFEGRATTRWRLTFGYRLDVATPGRVTSVRTKGEGTLVALAEPSAVPPSFADDLTRLVPARGEALEALERELAKVQGLVVSAAVETSAESSSEAVGNVPPGQPAAGIVRSTTTARRDVRHLASRPAKASDAALFAEPADLRHLGLERLLDAPAGLP